MKDKEEGSYIEDIQLEELTKVRSHGIAKRLKWFYEQTDEKDKKYPIYFDVANDTYGISNIDLQETVIEYIEIGKISWEQVMIETGRNNTLYGGEYIHQWVNERINTGRIEYYRDYEVKTFLDGDEDRINLGSSHKLDVGVLRYSIL